VEEALEDPEAMGGAADIAVLFSDMVFNLFDGISGCHQAAGIGIRKHGNVIEVIPGGEDGLSFHAEEAGDFGESGSLVELDVTEAGVDIIAHDGQTVDLPADLFEVFHNAIRVLVVGGDEAKGGVSVFKNGGLETGGDPAHDLGEAGANAGEQLLVDIAAAAVPGFDAIESVSIAPIDFAFHDHDEIGVYFELSGGKSGSEGGQIAAGINDPGDATRLEVEKKVLQFNRNWRLGAIIMQGPVKVSRYQFQAHPDIIHTKGCVRQERSDREGVIARTVRSGTFCQKPFCRGTMFYRNSRLASPGDLTSEWLS